MSTPSAPKTACHLWRVARVLGIPSVHALSLLAAGACAELPSDAMEPALAAAQIAGPCDGEAVMQVVAHQDDNLLFMSPDLLHDVRAGRCVRTVFVTAGDAGEDRPYWEGREAGSRAAYARMAGVPDRWTERDAGIAGHPIRLWTLDALPSVSLVALRLPDGCDGTGCGTRYGGDSLTRLWRRQRSVRAVDASSSYTGDELTRVIGALLRDFAPRLLRLQNFVDGPDDGDHADHHAAAYFAYQAHQQSSSRAAVVAYHGYAGAVRTQNVSGANLTAKQDAFFAYAAHDPEVCASVAACDAPAHEGYGMWLRSQYTVDAQNAAYELRSMNKCLDVRGPSADNGTVMQVWDCVGVVNQRWSPTFADTLRGYAGKCLDVRGPSTSNGTAVQLWECVGVTNQVWTRDAHGRLVGYAGKCLQARGGQTVNGTPVEMWDCRDLPEQQWTLRWLPPLPPSP